MHGKDEPALAISNTKKRKSTGADEIKMRLDGQKSGRVQAFAFTRRIIKLADDGQIDSHPCCVHNMFCCGWVGDEIHLPHITLPTCIRTFRIPRFGHFPTICVFAVGFISEIHLGFRQTAQLFAS